MKYRGQLQNFDFRSRGGEIWFKEKEFRSYFLKTHVGQYCPQTGRSHFQPNPQSPDSSCPGPLFGAHSRYIFDSIGLSGKISASLRNSVKQESSVRNIQSLTYFHHMVRKVSKQKVPTVTLDRVKPKNRNWKAIAKVKYVRTKRYVQGSKQRKVTTGIMECGNKQFRFNVWSDKGVKVPLKQNQIYAIAHAELDDKGIFNFGEHSIIQKGMDVEQTAFPQPEVLTVTQLLHATQEKTIDFQGYIQWAEKPYEWVNKETGMCFTKQNLSVVDVVERFSINVTLWDKFITKEHEGTLCKFCGFRLKIYGSARVITSTVYSSVEPMPDFKIDPLILQQIEFTTLSQNYQHRSFSELQDLLQGRQDNQIFYTKTQAQIQECITETPFYPGCPQCYCKIEENHYCNKCQKKVAKPVMRFILQFVVNDGVVAIRVKLFHRMSQHLLATSGLGLTTEQLGMMTPEQTKKHLDKLVGMKLKLGISSSVVTYKEEKYNKHTVLQLYTS